MVDGVVLGGEVEGRGRKLRRRAALHEEHLVVVRHLEQRAQVGLGGGGDAHEVLAAVRHLHDGHAAALHTRARLLWDAPRLVCIRSRNSTL